MAWRIMALALLAGVLGTVAQAQDPAGAAGGEAAENSGSPYKWNEFEIGLDSEDDELRVKFRFWGQHWTRYEVRSHPFFGGTNPNTPKTGIFLRTRFGLEIDFPYSSGLYFELQDARFWGDEGYGAANTGAYDLAVLQAYFHTPNLFDLGIDLKVGRQKFTLGTQRLWSTLEWSAPSRSWDGITMSRSFDEQYHVMLIGLLLDQAADPKDSEWMMGGTFRWTPDFLKDHEFEIDVLEFFRAGPATQDASVLTASLRFGGKASLSDSMTLKYGAEGIIQNGKADPAYWGSTGTDHANVKAFAALAHLDFVMAFGDIKIIPGIEINYASGDSDPTDGDLETFRSPFPFGHKYNGLSDQVGWRNLIDYQFRLAWVYTGWDAVKEIKVAAQFHLFDRQNDDDAWYNIGNGTIRPGADDSALNLGGEADLVVNFKINPFVACQIGLAHFFAGKFVKETATGTGPGVDDDENDVTFFYTQLTLKFG